MLGVTLLGSALTVLGFWLTFRHDRKLASEDRLQLDLRDALEGLSAIRAGLLRRDDPWVASIWMTWTTRQWWLVGRMRGPEPKFARMLAYLLSALGTTFGGNNTQETCMQWKNHQEALNALGSIERLLGGRLAGRATYNQLTEVEVNQRIAVWKKLPGMPIGVDPKDDPSAYR